MTAVEQNVEIQTLFSSNQRSFLKQFVPQSILEARKQSRWKPIRQRYAALSVGDAFSETYRTKLWGEAKGEPFYSGDGSCENFAVPYVELLTNFFREERITSVVDLGCGDFRVGRRLCANTCASYIGVDVVPELIAHNQSRFGRDGIEFRNLDIIKDPLPDGEVCLIRQVLQHLSNAEIAQVLAKCSKYPFLVVTEDVYKGWWSRPNLDHVHGPDNRLHKRSGVYVDLPPYSLKAETILDVPCPTTSSTIRTVLVRTSRPRG